MLSAKIDLSITRKCEVGGGSVFAVLGLWVAFVRTSNVLTLVRWVVFFLRKAYSKSQFITSLSQFAISFLQFVTSKLQFAISFSQLATTKSQFVISFSQFAISKLQLPC